MIWKNSYERAISGWSKRQERKQTTNDWFDQADPIKRQIYYILPIIKLVLIALITYLFVLTISEGIFTLQNVNTKAVGHYHQKGENQQIWTLPKYRTNV